MRILIVRTSALGDVVHCLPVLTALRRHYPEAHIGWVVEAAMAPVLAGHPDLNEVLAVRLRQWRRQPWRAEVRRQITSAMARLRRFKADLVLDLMGNHKAGVLAWLSGCGQRLGPARPFRREPSSALWINRGTAISGDHAVDRALAVLGGLNLPPEAPSFDPEKLFRAPAPQAEQLLAGHPEPFALIAPGAGWGNKQYPAPWWGAVARALREHAGIASWVPAGPGEEALAATVAASSDGAARDLGVVDLPTLAALMRQARLVLGGDSGPLHMAHALGASVLCLMGPTDPHRHGPYGAPERALWTELPCSFCYRRLPATKGCLLSLAPRQVAARALELLA